MTKQVFYPGDTVRFWATDDFGGNRVQGVVTAVGPEFCEVYATNGDNWAKHKNQLDFISHAPQVQYLLDKVNKAYWYTTTAPEKKVETRFKVGDRVAPVGMFTNRNRVSSGVVTDVRPGGVIDATNESIGEQIKVSFDQDFDYSGKDGWWHHEHFIVEPKPNYKYKYGDRVEVVNRPSSFNHGKIGTVIAVGTIPGHHDYLVKLDDESSVWLNEKNLVLTSKPKLPTLTERAEMIRNIINVGNGEPFRDTILDLATLVSDLAKKVEGK